MVEYQLQAAVLEQQILEGVAQVLVALEVVDVEITGLLGQAEQEQPLKVLMVEVDGHQIQKTKTGHQVAVAVLLPLAVLALVVARGMVELVYLAILLGRL